MARSIWKSSLAAKRCVWGAGAGSWEVARRLRRRLGESQQGWWKVRREKVVASDSRLQGQPRAGGGPG